MSEIVLPIKCSTVKRVKKITEYALLALWGAYSGLFFAMITVPYTTSRSISEFFGGVYMVYFAVTVSMFSFGSLCVYSVYLMIFEMPNVVCIKDEEEKS